MMPPGKTAFLPKVFWILIPFFGPGVRESVSYTHLDVYKRQVQEDVNGFIYQVREAVRCIEAGLLESPTVPHSMTLECCRVFEQVLGA